MTGQHEEATQVLAQFAASLRYDDIPDHVREYAKTLLLDALACAMAGHQGEETKQVAAFASALGPHGDVTVIGGEPLSLTGATFLNAFLITAVTMCDVHHPTITHVTPEVIPPALAIAERDSVSGRVLIAAIVAGCETVTRIGLGLDFKSFRARGWHGPGVLGPFGAAAAVGNLLAFDADTHARAFGLAGSQAAGTFAAWGTPTIKFHQSRGAFSGLAAALLAQQGYQATRSFLTASDGGLYATYSGGGNLRAVDDGLRVRWEMLQIALRKWPAAVAIQSVATAMFDLIERHRVASSAVRKVRVSLGRTAYDMYGIFPRYRGKFEALISTHYVVSVILHDRQLSLAQFEPARYDDPLLRSFAQDRVEVALDTQLSGVQVVVDVELDEGRMFTVRRNYAVGAPEEPLTRDQVSQKFRTYASQRLAEDEVDTVIANVEDLESLDSVRSLVRRLRISSHVRPPVR